MRTSITLGAFCALAVASAASAQTAAPATAPAPPVQASPAAAPAPVAAPTPASAPAATVAPTEATPAQPAAAGPVVAAAPAQPAAADALPADAPVTVYVSRVGPPPFVLTTPGNAVFGVAGAIVAIAQSKDMVSTIGLKDPSNAMAVELAKIYAKAHASRVSDKSISVDESSQLLKTKASKLSGQADGAHWIVDVDSSINSVYFAFDWTHYSVMLSARYRVIDTSNNKVVAKGHCFVRGKKEADSPDLGKMFDENGAKLKQMIDVAAEECMTKLRGEVIKP